ncbi:SMI1/KNR4 family protein [Thorsellia anophelis]|uniref:SMI1-KNR4 cell-wall n=1 Tax=Thorsellia anophelis DSM 18579 TaxID=1123402 RepID=A0A1I0G4E4_9GAMM|nr:SMI1/KNR4 family protein [Thorsellia anophelis]SET65463.1 SMI1-KNR4 cell-wall [Thorsellia anophelis DSM 18579]
MGTSDDAPSLEWIVKAEEMLTIKLPEDYKWILSHFGGGDICGEEIYSIYSFDGSYK